MAKQKGKLRCCSKCRRIFEYSKKYEYDCPLCGSMSYDAYWIYGDKADEYKKTQEPWRELFAIKCKAIHTRAMKTIENCNIWSKSMAILEQGHYECSVCKRVFTEKDVEMLKQCPSCGAQATEFMFVKGYADAGDDSEETLSFVRKYRKIKDKGIGVYKTLHIAGKEKTLCGLPVLDMRVEQEGLDGTLSYEDVLCKKCRKALQERGLPV